MSKLRVVSVVIFLGALALLGFHLVRNQKGEVQNAPAIEVDGELIEVSVHDDDQALKQGVTASDAEDGDLTEAVMVESIGRFNDEGKRKITYVVVDSDNHVAHAQRELIYKDYTGTQFSSARPFVYEAATTNLTYGLKAMDCIDGDLSSNVRLVSEKGIEIMIPGRYEAQLQVTNSAGATSVLPVKVVIVKPSVLSAMPMISLRDYIAYIPKGDEFDASAYLKSINIDGAEYTFTKDKGKYGTDAALEAGEANTINYKYIDIKSNVSTDVAGNYEVQYTFSDAEHGTGTATLYVVVTEGGSE